MDSLILKLILTPALIGAASLAGRRWGPAVSGWLVGLPLTSGPVAFFLALNHGAAFAAAAALGTLTGTLAECSYCLAYGWLARAREPQARVPEPGSGKRPPPQGRRSGWPLPLTISCLAFLATTAALQYLVLPPVLLFLIIIAALALTFRLMPPGAGPVPKPGLPAVTTSPEPPRWDILGRMVLATAFVLLLTGVAPALGPRLTGLLAPFPLYATILAAFAHQLQGPAAAAGVLRGLLLGLYAFASFFLVLALLIERIGTAPAFAAAVAAALGVQSGSLWVLRRANAAEKQKRGEA